MLKDIDLFLQALKQYRQIYIIGHIRPDVDCIASQLGMHNLCESLGIRAYCWNEGPFNRSESRIYKESFSLLSELPRDTTNAALCLTDCSELARAGAVPLWLAELPTFIVDHHRSVSISDDDPKILCDPDVPAAAAIVCELYKRAGCPLSEKTAQLLFAGIASDTYFFQYIEPHQKDIFSTARHLLTCGASPREVADTLMIKTELSALHMIGSLIKRSRPIENSSFLITTMTAEEKQECGAIESRILYDALFYVKSCRALVFLWEESKSIIVGNLRSKAPVTVNDIALHFGGGGHSQAAGFRIKNTKLLQVMHDIEQYIQKNKR